MFDLPPGSYKPLTNIFRRHTRPAVAGPAEAVVVGKQYACASTTTARNFDKKPTRGFNLFQVRGNGQTDCHIIGQSASDFQ